MLVPTWLALVDGEMIRVNGARTVVEAARRGGHEQRPRSSRAVDAVADIDGVLRERGCARTRPTRQRAAGGNLVERYFTAEDLTGPWSRT